MEGVCQVGGSAALFLRSVLVEAALPPFSGEKLARAGHVQWPSKREVDGCDKIGRVFFFYAPLLARGERAATAAMGSTIAVLFG